MNVWILLSRAVVALIGGIILAVSAGSLITNASGPSSNPLLSISGLALGLLSIAAALWTRSPGAVRASVVWLGVIGLALALVFVWLDFGLSPMETRDRVVYIMIPTAIVALAAIGVAVGRFRAGPRGEAIAGSDAM